MAKSYTCEICGAEFDTLSEYRRHMQTSHPDRAPSAADLEHALSGIDYPVAHDGLVRHARESDKEEIAEILEKLPEKNYKDAADVARAFGGIRAHEEKPTDKPSVRGGEEAMQTDAFSAARAVSLFAGMNFPASLEDLTAHARPRASQREMDVITRLPDRRYGDMSDVAKAFGEVKGEER